MKASILSLALMLSLSACGSKGTQSSDVPTPAASEKSRALVAQETYDSMQYSLSAAEKCDKLNDLADLYYEEGDSSNYKVTKSLANVACAMDNADKAQENFNRSLMR